MVNIANEDKGEDWVLSLPEWEHNPKPAEPTGRQPTPLYLRSGTPMRWPASSASGDSG